MGEKKLASPSLSVRSSQCQVIITLLFRHPINLPLKTVGISTRASHVAVGDLKPREHDHHHGREGRDIRWADTFLRCSITRMKKKPQGCGTVTGDAVSLEKCV